MTRLLCATDLLPKSEAAIDRAALLAQELGADLSLLHVVSPVTSERVLEHSLQTAIARMKSRARPPLRAAECDVLVIPYSQKEAGDRAAPANVVSRVSQGASRVP